jgi:hypothetical protein
MIAKLACVDAIGMLVQQLETVNLRFHHVAKNVTPDLMTASVNPAANPVGFLMWHMARSQDWAIHTAIRGVPEIAWSHRWSGSAVSTPGIGTGFSPAAARDLAFRLKLAELMDYADVVSGAAIDWVQGLDPKDLDAIPDAPRRADPGGVPLTPVGVEEGNGAPGSDRSRRLHHAEPGRRIAGQGHPLEQRRPAVRQWREVRGQLRDDALGERTSAHRGAGLSAGPADRRRDAAPPL